MADARDLLVEIGVEELPHATIENAINDFRELFDDEIDLFFGVVDTQGKTDGSVRVIKGNPHGPQNVGGL